MIIYASICQFDCRLFSPFHRILNAHGTNVERIGDDAENQEKENKWIQAESEEMGGKEGKKRIHMKKWRIDA